MKFKSQVYTQASGSIGGITYSHNAGGMYTRGRSIPTNANTVQQQVIRNAVSSLTALWASTLTLAQRAAWETYAENVPLTDTLGEPRNIGGLAMYVRCNVPRIQITLARVDIAPTNFTLGSLTPTISTADVSAQTLSTAFTNTDGWATAAGGALIIYQARAQGPAINYFKGPYRFQAFILGAVTPPVSPITSAAIFPFAITNKVFVQVRATFPDGRLTSPFRGSSTVVA